MGNTITWIGSDDGQGDWFDAGNWTGEQVPAAGNTAVVSGTQGGNPVGPSLTAAEASEVAGVAIQLSAATDNPIAGLELNGGDFGDGGTVSVSVSDGYGQLLLTAPVTLSGSVTDSNDAFAVGYGAFARIEANDGAMLTLSARGSLESGPGGAFYLLLGARFDGTLMNNGRIGADGGNFYANSATITGTGGIEISANGSFVTYGSIAAGQLVSFGAGGGTLFFDPADFAGTITALGAGDVLDFSRALDTAEYDAGTGLLTLGEDGQTVVTIAVGSITGTPRLVAGDGNTLLVLSDATRTFVGGTGLWFDPASWTTVDGARGAPQAGDIARITAGTVVLTEQAEQQNGLVNLEDIRLTGGAVLDARDAVFGNLATVAVRASLATATLHAEGTVNVAGTIAATGREAALTMVIGPDPDAAPGAQGTLVLDGGTLVAGEESVVTVEGTGTLRNEGLIVVAGRMVLGAGVTLDSIPDGTGIVQIQRDGTLEVDGAAANQGWLYFGNNGGELVIGNLSDFDAEIWNFGTGNVIDVAGATITGGQYDASSDTLTLSGVPQTLTLELNDPLARSGSAGFSFTSDGHGGTLIHYTPAQVQLRPMLPVPVVVAPGSSLTLTDVLQQAFGGVPAGVTAVGLSALSASALKNYDFSYWNLGDESSSDWTVNGKRVSQAVGDPPMPAPSVRQVASDAFGTVALSGGNQIAPAVYLTAQTGTTTQTAWTLTTVDPAILSPTAFSGRVDPTDIVASANRMAAHYGLVPNDNDCGWIGDVVAAASGATMPFDNYSTDPDANVSGGFWRVIYRGSDAANPAQDWGKLVDAGDEVRMGWSGGGQHTTSVLGVNADGSIQVYDNVAPLPDGDGTGIGIHSATYWTDTVPQSVTIYRLDPNHQYLIQAGSGAEAVQGSVFNNLIRPGGGADTVTAGAADNWVQGTAAMLDGTDWTDLHLGDVVDVQDLAPTAVTLGWEPGSHQLQVQSGGMVRATLSLPGSTDVRSFAAYADGSGGTAVVPVPVDLSGYAGDAETALQRAFAPLADAALEVHVQNNADFATPVSGEINIGLVAAVTGATYDADSLGSAGGAYDGVILTGSAAATVSGGSGGRLLVGNAAADQIVAGSVAATLVSGGHGSTLFGNGRSTLIAGATGAPDILVGGRSGPGDTLLGGSAAAVFFGGAVPTTIEAGTGGGAVIGGAGGGLVTTEGHATVSGGAGASTVVSHGADLIQGGIGAETVFAGGGATVFGGIGSLEFIGGASSSTVVGGSGACTLFGGGTGDALFAGNATNAVLVGDGASDTLVGGSGSVLWAASSGGVMVAGNGNETLVGGRNGLNTIFAGQGDATMLAGGSDLFVFSRSSGGGVSTINGFGGGDRLSLAGYGAGAVEQALNTATVSGGNTVLALADNTRITLLGVTNLAAASFT